MVPLLVQCSLMLAPVPPMPFPSTLSKADPPLTPPQQLAPACNTFQAPPSGEGGSCLPFPLREALQFSDKFIALGRHFFLKGGRATVPQRREQHLPFQQKPHSCIEHRGSSTSVHLSEQNGMEGGDSSRAGPCPQGIRWRHREATDGQKANCGLGLETPKKCL